MLVDFLPVEADAALLYCMQWTCIIPFFRHRFNSLNIRHVGVMPLVLVCVGSHGNGLTFPVRTVDEDYDNLLGQRQRWAEEGEADEPSLGQSYYLHVISRLAVSFIV